MSPALPEREPVYTEAGGPPRFVSWDWLEAKPVGVYVLVCAPKLRLRTEPLWSDRQVSSPGVLLPCEPHGNLRTGSWLVEPPWSNGSMTYSTGVCRWIDEPCTGRHWTEFAEVAARIAEWRRDTVKAMAAFEEQPMFMIGGGGVSVRPADRLYVVVRTDHPYLVDVFAGDAVFVLSETGRIATMSEHPDYARTWQYGLHTGEVWTALGERWIDHALGQGGTDVDVKG